jgi:hypothetical protein
MRGNGWQVAHFGRLHINADNVEGLRMGRKVAQVVWAKAQAQFEGKRSLDSYLTDLRQNDCEIVESRSHFV